MLCLNLDCQHHNPPEQKSCHKCHSSLLLNGRYRAIRYIGEGAFARTYEAIDEHNLNSKCLIKQFLPLPGLKQGSDAFQQATELFKREAEQLSKLGECPLIPSLLAFFEEEGKFYLIQEYVDGEDLYKLLKQKQTFSEEEVRKLLKNLLIILRIIHGQNIYHRDIKPENIIWRKDGVFVLIDFGVSKQLNSTILTKHVTIAGTPGYASPEQMHGEIYPASDIYSLGVTCIRLFSDLAPTQ